MWRSNPKLRASQNASYPRGRCSCCHALLRLITDYHSNYDSTCKSNNWAGCGGSHFLELFVFRAGAFDRACETPEILLARHSQNPHPRVPPTLVVFVEQFHTAADIPSDYFAQKKTIYGRVVSTAVPEANAASRFTYRS